ncbi:MAG: DUF4974 domain-containing protein [Prevotella sp.]|nr:DUF4974 domain-containing protein [Prevotella sp.]
MTREEKLRMLLHPEKHTDEELDRMLDEEKVSTPDTNEEWQRFQTMQYNTVAGKDNGLTKRLIRLAAMFVGVLMLSGIAYAAVRWWTSAPSEEKADDGATVTEVVAQPTETIEATPDSTQLKPVVFQNKELATMLGEMAAFYQCETVYKNEKVKHVRLYFTWDKTKPIDDVVETLNKFEQLTITRENQQLIVE